MTKVLAQDRGQGDEEFYADPRFFRDCLFKPDQGWVVPPERREEFADLYLPLADVTGGAPVTDHSGVLVRYRPWLEKRADKILGRGSKIGGMRDNLNRPVLELILDEDKDPEQPPESNREDVSALLADLFEVCELSHSEMAVIQAVVEGCNAGSYGWTDAVASRLGKSPANIRQTWSTAKRRIKAHWANEPEERTHKPLHSGSEGSGRWAGWGHRSWARSPGHETLRLAFERYIAEADDSDYPEDKRVYPVNKLAWKTDYVAE